MGRITKEFFDRFNIDKNLDIFFETGTFTGDAISHLLNNYNIFDEYHSVEIDTNRYNYCFDKFKNNNNVILYHGDSQEVLKNKLGDARFKDKKLLFWLDAHWMGDSSTQGDTHCPLLDELESIKQLNVKPIIVIDDLFYMLNRNDSRYENPEHDNVLCKSDEWPELDQIKSKIYEINKNYQIDLSLIKGKEDYLIAQ